MQKLNGKSKDIVRENTEKLKELFPEVFSEGKIDFQKLEEELGEFTNTNPERYNFTWAGKREAKKIAQTPSTGTLRPAKEESKDWDTTQNLYIEGDNLEVLKLLQKSYHKRVKMIYIDPPYNTGKEFIYPDNYHDNLDTYLKYTHQKGEDGKKFSVNADTSGRYHTNWLIMMYPRLKLARNLLKDDGVIFISIDDHEVANLRKLCDEIYGEDNFIATISWRRQDGQTNIGNLARVKEYILVYGKNEHLNLGRLPLSDKAKKDYQYKDKKGLYGRGRLREPVRGRYHYELISPQGTIALGPWLISEEEFRKLEQGELVHWPENGGSPRRKIYLRDMLKKGQIPNDFWGIEFGTNQRASLELESLFKRRIFDFPKPVSLLSNLINIGSLTSTDIILDFFSGSAATAHAIMKLNSEESGNKQFIMVQLPEETDEKSEAYKAGYKNICEIGKERIRRAGEKIKADNPDKDLSNLDIGFKVFKLDSSNIKEWDSDFDNLEKNLLDSVENIKSDRTQEDLLYEILLKYGLDLTLPIEEKTIDSKKVFVIGFGALVVCLDDDITTDTVEEIANLKKEYQSEIMRVVFKDSSFSNAVVKTNAIQILKQHAIDEVVSV